MSMIPPPSPQGARDPWTGGRVGRPRDPSATTRTLAAVQHLLATTGWPITVDAVASRAGVGKATIYRRWATVANLIADAVRDTRPLPPPPDPSGSTRAQLVEIVCRLAEPLSDAERSAAVAVAQSGWDPSLGRAAREVVLDPLSERVRRACRADRGAVPRDADVDAVVMLVEALWVRRCVVDSPPVDERGVLDVVDAVLLPLLARAA